MPPEARRLRGSRPPPAGAVRPRRPGPAPRARGRAPAGSSSPRTRRARRRCPAPRGRTAPRRRAAPARAAPGRAAAGSRRACPGHRAASAMRIASRRISSAPCRSPRFQRHEPEPVERPPQRQRSAALGEERARLLERAPRPRRACPRAPPAVRRPAASSPRVVGLPLSPARLDRPRAAASWARSGLEALVVDVVELEQHAALEIGDGRSARRSRAARSRAARPRRGRPPTSRRCRAPPARRSAPRRRPTRRRRARGWRARARSRCRRRG